MTSFQKVHALLFHILLLSLLPLKITSSPTTEAEALVEWKNSLSPLLPLSLHSSWSLTNIGNLYNWGVIVCDNNNNSLRDKLVWCQSHWDSHDLGFCFPP